MRKQDLDRLNELRKRFENDNEYKEYEKLLSEAGEEISKAKPERSPIGMVNGDTFVTGSIWRFSGKTDRVHICAKAIVIEMRNTLSTGC